MISLRPGSVWTSASRLLAIHLDHFAGFHGASAYQRGAAREHVHLAGKLPRTVHDNRCFSADRGWLNNFDVSGPDHQKRHHPVAGFEQHFGLAKVAQVATRSDAIELGGRQNRKCGIKGLPCSYHASSSEADSLSRREESPNDRRRILVARVHRIVHRLHGVGGNLSGQPFQRAQHFGVSQ